MRCALLAMCALSCRLINLSRLVFYPTLSLSLSELFSPELLLLSAVLLNRVSVWHFHMGDTHNILIANRVKWNRYSVAKLSTHTQWGGKIFFAIAHCFFPLPLPLPFEVAACKYLCKSIEKRLKQCGLELIFCRLLCAYARKENFFDFCAYFYSLMERRCNKQLQQQCKSNERSQTDSVRIYKSFNDFWMAFWNTLHL